ncbi:MAG TPA: threonine/serine dehydratase [Oligoflexia bacterium]|nr:threonine/serine dehydratase [Oligoflexia bacterium]HMP27755.1 threonine/serine dehydratase [Oligoflexia bacterium]
MPKSSTDIVTLAGIKKAARELGPLIKETPVVGLYPTISSRYLPKNSEFIFKCEIFQHAGSFKARLALLAIGRMSAEQKRRGVVAASAGNHGVGVAFAGNRFGVSVKIFMPRSAQNARVELAKFYGAEIIYCSDIFEAFARAVECQKSEERVFIHPFEGEAQALANGTIALEILKQVPKFDYLVVPVGGGGLIAGMSAAIKESGSRAKIIGVEPKGAPSLWRSFRSGKPEALSKVATIADSLAPPRALPFSFALARRFVDEIVLVDDDLIVKAQYLLFHELKVALEPAGATAFAGLMGPLCRKLSGKRIVSLLCGSNIDCEAFVTQLDKGQKLLNRG